jgi:hypothetical protein
MKSAFHDGPIVLQLDFENFDKFLRQMGSRGLKQTKMRSFKQIYCRSTTQNLTEIRWMLGEEGSALHIVRSL